MTSPSDHSRKKTNISAPKTVLERLLWPVATSSTMTRAGDFCVQLCERTRGLPKLILCLCLVILQGAMFNVFMYLQLGPLWLCWFLYDALNLAMCIAAFVLSSRFKEEQRKGKSSRRTIGWLAWMILEVSPNQVVTSAKVRLSQTIDTNSYLLLQVSHHSSSISKDHAGPCCYTN